MTAETRYLSVETVIAIQIRVMEETGTANAIPSCNTGSLDAALTRVLNAAHYDNADIVRQAAVLMVAVTKAHAFGDGNKRTAMMAGELFLGLNGLWYGGTAMDLADALVRVAARQDHPDSLVQHIDDQIRPSIIPV